MQKITFITSHPKKAEEISWYLGHPVTHHKLDLPEIQSLDPHEVTRIKAEEAYRQLGCPVLVEDFSIRFEALGKLPGPLIRWFLQELKVEGLCKLISNYENRIAYAQDCFGYCDKNGVRIFDGTIKGAIAPHPRGDNGYGTDSIFIPDGQHKTWGEMNKEEQIQYSLRRIGLKKLVVRDSEGMLCVKPTAWIKPAIEEAIHQIAPKSGDPFAFEFNDVYVTVTRGSDPELILRDWHLADHKKIPNNVGPYPKPVLTRKMQREYDAILQWLKSR